VHALTGVSRLKGGSGDVDTTGMQPRRSTLGRSTPAASARRARLPDDLQRRPRGAQGGLRRRLPGRRWQRCQVHHQRSAAAYAPRVDMRKTVTRELRDVFNAVRRFSGPAVVFSSWPSAERGTRWID